MTRAFLPEVKILIRVHGLSAHPVYHGREIARDNPFDGFVIFLKDEEYELNIVLFSLPTFSYSYFSRMKSTS
jgi:hypothetical protein